MGGGGFLDTEDAIAFTEHWRGILAAQGYLAPAWPTRYGGGGLTKLQQVVIVEEFAKAGVPANGAHDNFSIKMIGNLLLRSAPTRRKTTSYRASSTVVPGFEAQDAGSGWQPSQDQCTLGR